jgi:citrate synthase
VNTPVEQGDQWIDAEAAASRLGVKPATLYAYVSRGVLHRRPGADGRRSLFDAAEIEELARRGKPRHKPSPSEITVVSHVTVLGEDRPFYRGHDALALAGEQPYETVAELLWSGELTPGGLTADDRAADLATARGSEAGPWQARAEGVAAARAAQSGIPDDALPLDRLQLIVTALAVTDPMRYHLDPPAVRATGRALIAGMVDALPSLTDAVDDSIAGRLWGKLCRHPPSDPAFVAVLDAALVLLADHELAASTFAARVAASVQADAYAVVATGLGVVGGPMHGGASLGVERLLAETTEPANAARAIGDRMRRGERIPGAGHSVYKSGDGRGDRLFALLRAAAPDHGRLAVAEALLVELRARRLPEPNIDFALATFGAVADLVEGAGEAVFAIARTAGWLAHALEEYEKRKPLRPRAIL